MNLCEATNTFRARYVFVFKISCLGVGVSFSGVEKGRGCC